MTMTPRLNTFIASPAAMPDKILIIGGGFAGFWAALAARRVAGPRAGVPLAAPELALELGDRLLAHGPAISAFKTRVFDALWWTPVRRQEHAPTKESRACSDSAGMEHALGHGADGVAERLRIVLIDRAQTVGPEL